MKGNLRPLDMNETNEVLNVVVLLYLTFQIVSNEHIFEIRQLVGAKIRKNHRQKGLNKSTKTDRAYVK